MTDKTKHSARILVADDEPGMRLALREVLQRSGWWVTPVECGERALELLQGDEAFDLLVTDFRMPGMNGMELLRAARAARPELPVVMMTAYGTVEDAVAAMRAGASDYLLKPFSYDTVTEVVRRALELRIADPPSRGYGGTSCGLRIEEDERSGRSGRGGRSGGRDGQYGEDGQCGVDGQDGIQSEIGNPKSEIDEVGIIANSPTIVRVLEVARDVASSDATILLTGESGTGKEVVARFIHRNSGRRGAFVAVNCAALPEGLLESELFGHEKGAFTGAAFARKGRFEQADGGTLLLDEVSEMPLALQAKLLRVLQEKEVSPVGGSQTIKLDARIIATTNRDVEGMVARGTFRQDLFYRLNVISLPLPPLRERPEDIEPFAEQFLRRFQRPGRPERRLSDDARRTLWGYAWPGNVRELENMMERASLLAREEIITVGDLHLGKGNGLRIADCGLRIEEKSKTRNPSFRGNGELQIGNFNPKSEIRNPQFEEGETATLEEMERRMILATLDRTGGNRTKTADLLGVSVRTIRNKLNQYGVKEGALAG